MGKENELLEAARVGNVNIIDRLLSVKQKNVLTQALSFRRSVSANCQDGSGYTPLHHAVLNGHCLAVQQLLKYDASPIVPDNNGNTPLHLAAWTGNSVILVTLLIAGISRAQVNEQNNDLDSHLHFAAQYGHTGVVEILLENGANPDVLNKKEESPLDLASQYGHLEVVNVLLRSRPQLLDRIPQHRSLLHLAARNGHHLVIKKLLEYGCDINKKLSSGTALHEAALFGRVEVVRVLLESRPQIDVYTKDNKGETALEKIQGHSPKIAKDIASLIKAFSRGEPLPEPSSPAASLCQSSDGDDVEPPSVYDNLPSKGNRTLPLVNRRTWEESNRSYQRVQLNSAKSSSKENYVNMRFGEKLRKPPKKPARVSIGNLLEQLNENGLTERPDAKVAPVYSPSMYELEQPLREAPEESNDDSIHPGDQDQDSGDYAMLRLDAQLVRPSPMATHIEEVAHSRSSSSTDSQGTHGNSLPDGTVQPPEIRRMISAPIASIDSDPEDIEVYELLADAVTGNEKKTSAVVKPIPAPRSNVSPRVTAGNITPETPSHPPPSPHTAMLGVQARISQHQPPDVGASEGDHFYYEPPGNRTSTHTAPPGSTNHTTLPTQHFVFQNIPEPLSRRDLYSKPVPADPSHTGTGPTNNNSMQPPDVHYEALTRVAYRDVSSAPHGDVGGAPNGDVSSAPYRNLPSVPPREDVSHSPHGDVTGVPYSPGSLSGDTDQGDVYAQIDAQRVPVPTRSKPVPQVRMCKPRQTKDEEGVHKADEDVHEEDVAVHESDDAISSSSCDSDILRPDETDPFAGLVKGSNCGQLQGGREMGTDTKGGSGHQAEESNGLDESSEWAQIESIMASFGAGLVRESVWLGDYEINFQKMLEGNEKPRTVAEWLDKLGIGQYLYTLIANGFDNLKFLDSSIMTDQDLREIGIQDDSHRKLLLEAAKCLPKIKSIGDGEGHLPVPSSITEWLRSLVLSDYIHNFTENHKATMEKVRTLWDVELENVLEIHMLGHRKRILASLGGWRIPAGSRTHSLDSSPRLASKSAADLMIALQPSQQSPTLVRSNSSSLDIDLFKDYSKDLTSPSRMKPGKEVRAWTLPERHKRHHAKSMYSQTYTHSEESLPEELHARSPELSVPSRKTTHEIGTQVTPGIDNDIPDIIKTDDKNSLKRHSANGVPTQAAGELGDSASLDVIANTQQQWMHRPDDLVTGCCNYTASYLGSTIVKELQGTDSTRLSCVKLMRSASHVQKVPTITLSISYAGVKFIDTKSKKVITEHEICNISCVSQYEEDMKTFAYVTRDETYDRIYCHVFTVKSLELATEIILTLGQAFELAYQLLVKTHPPSKLPPLISAETEDTKL